MKTLHLSIVAVAGIVMVASTNFAFAETQLNNAILQPFKESELVLVGKVIETKNTPSENKTQYSIAVEKYLKNPKPFDLLTAVGSSIRKEITDPSQQNYFNQPVFEKGDRVFLYLNQKDGQYVISQSSFLISRGDMVHPPGSATIRPDKNTYYGNEYVSILGVIDKGFLYTSETEFGMNSTVSIVVSNPNKEKYLDDQVNVKPDGSFIYQFKIKGKLGITGSYESVINVGSGGYGATFDYVSSPLDQFKSGIPLQDIQCGTGLVLVIKAHEGTPACVRQSSIAKLVYRGWASLISNNPELNLRILGQYDGLQNLAGIVTIQNKTFFMTTFNGTLNPYSGYQEVAFHGINFTLFPQPQSLEISGKEFYADVGFSENVHEQLWLEAPIYADMGNLTITRLTHHMQPQAGIVSYNEHIKLLVSTDVNSTLQETTISNSSSNGPEYKVGPDLLGPIPHQLVFFMKSNSTAKIFVEYTSNEPNTGTIPSYSSVYVGKGNFTPLNSSDVTINADPQSIPLTQGSDTTVVYTVTAKGVKGVYWISLAQFCGIMPLAIDINSLTISPFDIPVQTGTMHCPAQFLNGKILGISGGTAEYKIGQPTG